MIKVTKTIVILVLAGISLIACNKKTDATQTEVKQEEEKEIVVKDSVPAPLKVYTADGMSVKAYNYEGLKHFLNQKNDTTYVVNFWATWCVPCVAELPHFEALNEKYKDNKVKVLLVSLDMDKKIESQLIPFIKKRQLKSEVIILRDPDADSWISQIDSSWTGAIPATLIYNKDQRKFYEKSFTYDGLEKEVSNFK
jgi:thiol-disulfide isomerase/thioredoxin